MSKKEKLDNISIVLVEPMDGQNIGSVCRAAKTMGIKSLKIVANITHDENRVKQLAVHAADLWENRKTYKTLEDAIKDSSLAVAFTRRKGKFRKLSSITPEHLATRLNKMPDGKIDLVFGRESNGLTDDEVKQCNLICTIETSKGFPSLNLAQAVQIACYTLFTNLTDYERVDIAINQERAEKASKNIAENLENISFFKKGSDERENDTIIIRDFLLRAGLSENETKRVEKLFSKIEKVKIYK